MNNEFGLKELTDLTLKATYPIEAFGKTFEEGEVIARFDKIQLANFNEVVSRISATGGYQNQRLIIWEDPKEIQLNFVQGVFSQKQFALLCNSRLVNKIQDDCILVPQHFTGESDENGIIRTEKKNISKVFVYDARTFEKIKPIAIDEEEGIITIDKAYCDVEVDFIYCYQNSATLCAIGQKMFQGYLRLEGKTRVKEDITGLVKTALLCVPRLKLMSDLSMRLGREATPVQGNFSAIGLPVGAKGSKKVMELAFLDNDIDAEM